MTCRADINPRTCSTQHFGLVQRVEHSVDELGRVDVPDITHAKDRSEHGDWGFMAAYFHPADDA